MKYLVEILFKSGEKRIVEAEGWKDAISISDTLRSSWRNKITFQNSKGGYSVTLRMKDVSAVLITQSGEEEKHG